MTAKYKKTKSKTSPQTPLACFGSRRAQLLKHLLFTLILLGLFLSIYSLEQFSAIQSVAHWTWILASPALAVYLVASIVAPGGDESSWAFLPLVWLASLTPIFGWIFFGIAIVATGIFQMVLSILHFIEIPMKNARR